MKSFDGIEISEFRLLTETVVMTLLAVIVITVTIICCRILFTGRDKKKLLHLKKLKEKASCDEVAKKKLDKLERKHKRQRKRGRSDFVTSVVILTLCISLALTDIFLCVIPGWTDYIKKDYAVYTGEFKVVDSIRRPNIVLEDGTRVWGDSIYDGDDNYGTIVYAKRSCRLLGPK